MKKVEATKARPTALSPVVGVICEYDPFHLGHQRHFALIRRQLPNARIVCVMSGPFTQRGMPALYAPAFRAHAALLAGADMVLELPVLFALREAEHFALGGVAILHLLGFISHISFGCESESLDVLMSAAQALEMPSPLCTALLKKRLQHGASFASAQAAAITETLCQSQASLGYPIPKDELSAVLAAPNNILAISYLRALLRLESHIQPLPVLREGSYHAQSLQGSGFPSATAVRHAILEKEWLHAQAACGYPLPHSPMCRPEALDSVLLHALRNMDKSQLAALPDCSEGLENRLYIACRKATDRVQLLEMLKTKRYPHARLSRLCTHGMLGITQALQKKNPMPTYASLLGFRKESEGLLALLNQSDLSVIAKASHGPLEEAAYQLDARAYDLWALGAGQPTGLMFTQPVQIIP